MYFVAGTSTDGRVAESSTGLNSNEGAAGSLNGATSPLNENSLVESSTISIVGIESLYWNSGYA